MSATMTPAPSAGPPTEADIRQELATQMLYKVASGSAEGTIRAELVVLAHHMAGALRWFPPEPDELPGESGPWADLRPSEFRRLDELLDAAVHRAVDRSLELLLDELTAAALQFGQEHPDAPRGVPQPPPGRTGEGAAA